MRYVATVFALCMIVLGSGQVLNGGGPIQGSADRLRVLKAPAEVISPARALLRAGQFDRAASLINFAMDQYPGDPDLRYLGFEVALIRGRFAELEPLTRFSDALLDKCPELRGSVSGKTIDAGLLLAECNGVETEAGRDRVEKSTLKAALGVKDALPFEMITDEGSNTRVEVIAYALLIPGFGANGPRLLARLAQLYPKDTFVLELRARESEKKRKFDDQCAFLKKALEGPCSKERKKYLAKLISEAKEKAEYQRSIGGS